MAETKPLSLPKFGGAAASAGARPLSPTIPLLKAEKRFMPRPIKRKHSFNKSATAFSNKSPIAFPKGS